MQRPKFLRLFIFLAISFLVSCSTLPPQPPTPPKVIWKQKASPAPIALPVDARETPVEQITAGFHPLDIHALKLVVEGKLAGVTLPDCPLGRSQAKEALARLDEMYAAGVEETANGLEGRRGRLGGEWVNCRMECTCGFYFEVLDKHPRASVDQMAFTKIKQDAARTTRRELGRCAMRYQSLCKTKLMEHVGFISPRATK